MLRNSYFRYWGKTGKDGDYHLLPFHCLDVAAVASAWWDASPALRRSFALTCDEQQVRAWLLFFCALHDYGKFDLRFQFKDPKVFQELNACQGNTRPSEKEVIGYWHGEAGLYWFHKDLVSLYGKPDSGNGLFSDEEEPEHWNSWKRWIEAVTGHHGHLKNVEYVADADFSRRIDACCKAADQVARVEWLNALEALFLKPAGLNLTSSAPEPSPLLAGLCSIADWLGSRCDSDNFTFQSDPENLNDYFVRKVAGDAQRVLDLSGIIGKPTPWVDIESLLPPGKSPRPLQSLVGGLSLQAALTIIEGATGSGKTEAALAHAWKLVHAGLAESIIFALPTQATANAMFSRLQKVAKTIFADSPNLLLAHGHANQNEEFASLKKHRRPDDGEEQDGWIKCSEWLAESRKRVFLGQIGVCTIDQVLISVLPVRHRFVRGFGVGRSVLIVDEVHAYDAYMYGLLEEVLKQQKAAGGSAILLSATLPEEQKRQLFVAWGADLKTEGSGPYPLISTAIGHIVETCGLPEEETQETVSVNLECIRVPDMVPDTELLSRLIRAAESGAQVAVICNLVDATQSLYEQLLSEIDGLPIEVDLFHARFRFRDRQNKEKKVIKDFGLEGDRSRGRILVATQVVEQSLDVDFDWLVTQLCPADLLFQRMGRLHRHRKNDSIRPPGFSGRLCTVLLPAGDDYGGTGAVYANTQVLWRTEQMVLNFAEITFPEAYRTWIDKVYRGDSQDHVPQWVEEASVKFEEEIWGKRFSARQMIMRAFEVTPFTDSDERITAVTRDGEMSLQVIPYLAIGKSRQTIDGESLNDMDEYQLLEVLMLNSIGVPAGWRGYLEKVAKYEDGRYWLEMQAEKDRFVTNGEAVRFVYHRDSGLRRVKK